MIVYPIAFANGKYLAIIVGDMIAATIMMSNTLNTQNKPLFKDL